MSTAKMREIYKAFNADLDVLVQKEREKFEHQMAGLTKAHCQEIFEMEALRDKSLVDNKLSYHKERAEIILRNDAKIAAMQIEVEEAQDAVMAVPEYKQMLDEQATLVEALRRELDVLTVPAAVDDPPVKR